MSLLKKSFCSIILMIIVSLSSGTAIYAAEEQTTAIDLDNLTPDPVKVAQVEELERQGVYYATDMQKYWYVRLNIDYDTFDMSDPHTPEEMMALNGYLGTLKHEEVIIYNLVHARYKEYMRTAELSSRGYEPWRLDDNQIEEMRKAEQLFVDNYISEDMSDFEKEMEIIKYLCDNVEYDHNYEDISYTGYGALINGYAVCDGYSNAFYRLCTVSGIEANIVNGIVNSGERHEWNMVKLDDAWYEVDVTWADGDDFGFQPEWINGTASADLPDHEVKSVNTGTEVKKATGDKYDHSMVLKYFNNLF